MLLPFTVLQTHVLWSDLCEHADVRHTGIFPVYTRDLRAEGETGGRKATRRSLKEREDTKGGHERKVKGSE